MATKSKSKKTTSKTVPAPATAVAERGDRTYRKAKGSQRPFWTPNKPEAEHPKELECVIDAFRESEGFRKKAEPQKIADVTCLDGTQWSIPLKTALAQQFEAEQIGEGQQVLITYDGEKKVKGRSQPMQLFTVYIAE